MERGIFFIVLAVIALCTGNSLHFLSREKSSIDYPSNKRNLFYIGGSLFTIIGGFLLWSGQHIVTIEALSNPVIDFSFDKTKNVLLIKNLGVVDVEDIKVYATSYLLKAEINKGHVHLSGIDSFSKLSKEIGAQDLIRRHGGIFRVDLAPLTNLIDFKEGIPQPEDSSLRTVHCFRILFRNPNTKQKYVYHLMSSALRDLPSLWGQHQNSAFGGGYESSRKLFEIQTLIKDHQLLLFDDDLGDLYRN